MKANTVKIYAKALAEVSVKKGADEKKISANFAWLLIKEGLERKAKDILRLAESMILEKRGKKRIAFETARKITPHQKKMLDGLAKEGDLIEEKINPEIIAGIKIIINDSKQFDASMKSKLQNIF